MDEGKEIIKTHWLHGDIKFKVDVAEEDDCMTCLHVDVCSMEMSKCCINYDQGSSDLRVCDGCIKRYIRAIWNKDGFPCFKCSKRIVKELNDICPHKEDSLDDDEWKGTCELDGGDCTFPLNPKDWRACDRLHQDVCPVSRIEDAHQQIRAQVLEEVRLAALSATVQEFKDGAYVYRIDAFKFDKLLSELKEDVKK